MHTAGCCIGENWAFWCKFLICSALTRLPRRKNYETLLRYFLQSSLGCLRQSAVADGKRSATFLSRTSPIQSCRRCLYLRVWLAHYWSCPLFEFCLVNRFALPVFFLLLVACPALLAASPPLSHDPAPSSRGNAPAPSTATASTSIRSTSRHNTVPLLLTAIPAARP